MKYLSVFTVVLALTGCFGATPEKTGLEGKTMPSFHLLLQDSTTWFASSRIPSGKPFVLLYFSPYCPFCHEQLETITKRMDKLKNIPFYLVTNFPPSTIRQFCTQYQLAKYPNLLVGQDSANTIGAYFQVSRIPFLAIFGKDRKLNKSFVGRIYASQIKEVAEE